MELEEILQLNRYPFNYDVMGGEFGRASKETQRVEEVRLAIFLHYMDKFIEHSSCRNFIVLTSSIQAAS